MSKTTHRGLLPLWLCSVAAMAACQISEEGERDGGPVTFSTVTQSFSLGSVLGVPISTSPAPTSTCGLNNGVNPGCGTSNASDISFEWVAPSAGTYTFTTNGSNFDTALVIAPYTSPSGRLACRNSVLGTGGESATLTLTVGQRLLITIDGYASLCGNYQLNVTKACSAGCSSTACSTATCLPTGVCSYAPRPVGTSCNDGNECTHTDSCNASGSCAGTPEPHGTACSDDNNCTGGDYCSAGFCYSGSIDTCTGGPCSIYGNYEDCGNGICCESGTSCTGLCIAALPDDKASE